LEIKVRNLEDVIDQMTPFIPQDEEGFLSALDSIKKSAIVSAPEMRRHWWFTAAYTLTAHLPNENEPFNEWQCRVRDIWLNKNE
jgi:hypothetical protein